MAKARYAIVRVNFVCPNTYEGISYKFVCQNNGPIKNFQCDKCRYGDTKEQLERKIAQVLLREKLEWYRKNLNIIPKGEKDEPLVRNLYEHCLDKAKKIVEFLGVE